VNKKTITILTIILAIVAIAGGFWYASNQNNVILNPAHRLGRSFQNLNNDTQESQKPENQNNVIPEKSGIQNEQNSETISQNNQDNTGENLMFKKFTPEEAEKLKKEKDLVWYEVPELGVEFLVTKNEKKDLKYKVNKGKDSFNKDQIYIFFYSQQEIDYKNNKLNYHCFEGNDSSCYNDIFLSKISIDYNNSMIDSVTKDSPFVCKINRDDWRDSSNVQLLKEKEYYICGGVEHQAFNWSSVEEYEEFLKYIEATSSDESNTTKVQTTSIYFGSIRKIK